MLTRSRLTLLLFAVSCSSRTPDSDTAGGGRGGTSNDAGSSSTSGGASASGTGGSAVGGSSGTSAGGTASPGGSGGSGGSSAPGGSGGAGGSAGGAGGQAGDASVAGAQGAGAGAGAAGASGLGGGGSAGSAAGNGGSGPAGASGSGGTAGSGVGCDWTNPDGRVVLFDGTSLANFRNSATSGPAHWRLVGDGTMEVVPANPSNNIESTMGFEDACLHLEYLTPMYPANVTGQQRGNSGIYFRGAYEMQVLDTYGQPPAIDGCGAVYSVSPPLVVACNMQLVWNTYEIEFKAARWNASGTKVENAVFIAARLNGMLVQREVELNVSATTAGQADARGARPLVLQDHGNLVRFRNIWLKVPRY